MSATLFLGDCIQKMKDLPDKSIDCFICDLPYGQLSKGCKSTGIHPQTTDPNRDNNICSWDIKLNLEEFWKQVIRLCKDDHTPVLMFCNTKFGYELIKSNENWFRYDLIWNKQRGVSFLLANKMPMKSHEMIYVFSKKSSYYKRIDVKTDKPNYYIDRNKQTCIKSRQYGGAERNKTSIDIREDGMRCPLSVINATSSVAHGLHPTEKPKELYEWLLKRYCPYGGTVLDPTAGSFNSIIVAKQLGLHGIGIEKDEEFFNKALEKFTE